MAHRQIIAAPDIPEHPQPFPTAVRVGNVIFSSSISGKEGNSGEASDDLEIQVARAFTNMRRVVEEGGGSTGDIGKVVVYLRDRKHRDVVNKEWIKMFPDELDRPVRHTVATELSGKLQIQLEFIAVVRDAG
jgi:enamine deaminase RidA (YjgF/YER057c/UK114 family)